MNDAVTFYVIYGEQVLTLLYNGAATMHLSVAAVKIMAWWYWYPIQ